MLNYAMSKKRYKITTKRGDHGQSDILFNERRHKSSQIFLTMAYIDAASADIGVARTEIHLDRIQDVCKRVQDDLQRIMSCCCVPEGKMDKFNNVFGYAIVDADASNFLEKSSDVIKDVFEENGVDPLATWVVYGDNPSKAAALLYKARASVRLAELSFTHLVVVEEANCIEIPNMESILKYLNRLSDFLFMLAKLFEEVALSQKFSDLVDKKLAFPTN